MTFDDVMKKYNGFWVNNRAKIKLPDGHEVMIAVGTPESYEVISDGKRYVTEDTPVASEIDKPRRGRKPAAVLDSVDM